MANGISIPILVRFRKYLTKLFPDAPGDVQKAVILLLLGSQAMLFSFIYAGIYLSMDLILPAILCTYAGVSVFVVYWLIFKKRNLYGSIHFYCLTTMLFFTSCALFSGAIHSPFVPWLTTAPIMAAMLLSPKATLLWALSGLGIIVGLLIIEPFAPSSSYFGYPEAEDQVRTLAFSSYFLFVFGMIFIYDEVRKEMERLLRLTEVEKRVVQSGLEENIEGRERERQRVSREFHDHLGTVLAVLRLRHEAAYERRGKKDISRAFFDRLEAVGELLNEASRRYSLHLLRDFGLANALDQLAIPFKRRDLPFELITMGLERPEVEKHNQDIFRIVQEVTELSLRRPESHFVSIQVLALGKEIKLIAEIQGKELAHELQSDTIWQQGLGEIKDRSHVMGADLFYEVSPQAGLTLILEKQTR